MHYITEIGLTSRFFQVYHAYHTVYHKNSGTLPLSYKIHFHSILPSEGWENHTPGLRTHN